ncbi:MAG: hypothetical protein AAFN40_26375 [Cyanobacteria bacterium J06560_6]
MGYNGERLPDHWFWALRSIARESPIPAADRGRPWIKQGITIQIVRGLRLFKFTEELQQRFEELIDIQ